MCSSVCLSVLLSGYTACAGCILDHALPILQSIVSTRETGTLIGHKFAALHHVCAHPVLGVDQAKGS